MPTVIDSLLITLGLDASGYKKGQKEAEQAIKKTGDAASKSSKDAEKAARDYEQAMKKVKDQILGVGSALFGMAAIKSFTQQITAADANVGRLAKNVGMAEQDLTAWQGAAKKAGGSIEGMSGSIKGLVGDLERAKLTGNSAFIPVLNSLGIIDAIDPSTGKLKDVNELLLEISDKLAKMSAPQAQQVGQMLGFDEGTVNLLMKGRAEVSKALEEQRKLNVINKEDAELAQKREKAMSDLKDQLTDIGRKVLTDVTPALLTFAGVLKDVLSYAQEHGSATKIVVEGLIAVFAAWSAIRFAGLISDLFKLRGAAIAAAEATAAANAVGGAGAAGKAAGLSKLGQVGAVVGAGALGYEIGDKAIKPLIDYGASKAAGYDATLGSVLADKFRKDEETKALGQMVYKITPRPGGKGYQGSGGSVSSGQDSPFSKLLFKAEGDYNSVNLGAKGGYKSASKDLSSMTLAEVMAAQRAGEFNAAGHYQMIKDTLAEGARKLNLSGNEKFDKALQDRLFNDYILKQKRPSLGKYLSGQSNDEEAALAAGYMEWAGLPMASGASFHGNTANNKANISYEAYRNALRETRAQNIAKQQGGQPNNSEVNIGSINIQTQATDANGIMKDVRSATNNQLTALQANVGFR